MAQRFTLADKRIAKILGVTPLGLQVLSFALKREDGRVKGGGTAVTALAKRDHVEYRVCEAESGCLSWYAAFITDSGRDIVAQARSLGW